MPIIKKKKTIKKTKTKPTKKLKKPVSRALVKAKPTKNTRAYYECLKSCCKGQKITQATHHCKHNALTINAKMSATKAKAVKKIQTGYQEMGQGLKEFIKACQ